MDKQVIITLGREFGSGGHLIARGIAKELDIPYYDRSLLDHMFEGDEERIKAMKRYDESVTSLFTTRHVRGFTNSAAEHLANMQFEFINKKAAEGESFVLVGRCGEYMLQGFPNLISLFVLGDTHDKIRRVMERDELPAKAAIDRIQRHDRSRKKFHNTYSTIKWGDSRGYDVCINSSRLGIEGSVEALMAFINARIACFE